MENILKRVPPWAYVASAGVVGGVFAFRFINRKGETVSTKDAGDATAVGDYGSTDQSGGGAGTGVIIPPVVIGGQQDDSLASGYQNLQDLFVGGTQGLLDTLTGVIGGLSDTIGNAYEGGGGIAISGVQTGADIVTNAIALTGGGAPNSPPAPTAVQSSPPPPAVQGCPGGWVGTPGACCPSDYPFHSGEGCYQVIPCQSHHRWHAYHPNPALGGGRKVAVGNC